MVHRCCCSSSSKLVGGCWEDGEVDAAEGSA